MDSITITWSVEDVKSVCPECSDELAARVLRLVRINHDADVGVCWQTLVDTYEAIKP